MDKAFFFPLPATVPDDISAKLHKKRIAVTLPRLFTIRMTLFHIKRRIKQSHSLFRSPNRSSSLLLEETDFPRQFAPLKTRALAFFNPSVTWTAKKQYAPVSLKRMATYDLENHLS